VHGATIDVVAATDDDQLELQQAADELGVHYQTAYRWVRSGRLPASLVRGRYCVARRDLATVQDELRTPAARRPPGARRLDAQQQRMFKALVDGDEPQARHIARTLVAEGTKIVVLLQRVLVPALGRIGDAWHHGELPVWAEHRASAIVERILGDLAPNPRGRRRGVVAVASITGDHHALPTSMATVALRAAHWHVHHLGADTPPADVVQFCTQQQVDLAVLTVTNPDSAPLAEGTARTLRRDGIPTLVGGPGRTLDELLDQATQTVTARQARR
jgi:excisionase family DNA binding protein